MKLDNPAKLVGRYQAEEWNMQGNQGTNLGSEAAGKKFFVPLLLLGIALAGFCVYMVSKAMSDRYTVKPEKVFNSVFEDSFSSVTDFKGGGSRSAHDNMWIYFKKAGEAQLKDKSSYKGHDRPEVARRYFEKLMPESEGLKPKYRAVLKLKSKVDNSSAHIIRSWYLFNWRTDEHYFREWGY